MNYKKSILSLVTIIALSGTASADGTATYIPLTSDDNDASWTLFGVNGFSDGTASSRAAVAVGFSAGYVEVKERNPQDSVATWGLSATGGSQPATDNLLSVQAVDDTGIRELKVAAEVLQPYEKTEPVRSMYIKINSNTPNVKIDYKSSMEGQPLELMVNGVTTLYAVTLNEDNTYSNAALAIESSPVESTTAKLSNIVDVLDYNFINNPLDARYYSKEDHLNVAKANNDDGSDAQSAIFYHFDSVSQQWKIWNKKFSGSANDFTAFSKGDAYWGQVDTNDVVPTNNTADVNVTASGLVLGSSGISTPSADVYTDKLTNGWNMLAIDDSRPYIRHASTGIVATMVASDGNITVTDSSGLHPVKIELLGSTDSIQAQATKINVAIESAKLLRTIPASVNIKAFRSSATEIVFISDAKFTLTDNDDGNNISKVKTLTDREPYNADGLDGKGTNAIVDLNESATGTDTTTGSFNAYATSAYGEYGMVIDLLVTDLASDDGTVVKVAADLDALDTATGDTHSAMIRIGTADKDYPAFALDVDPDGQPDEASAIIEIMKHPLFSDTAAPIESYGKAIGIDTNGNGTNDKLLLASTVPFYIKDNTFTRVFDYANTTNDGSRAIEVVGTSTSTIKPATGATNLATALQISAKADGTSGTGVYADYNSTKLIAVSTTLSTFDIKDLEDGEFGFLTAAADTTPLSQGAIAGVYSIDSVAQLDLVQHKITVTGFHLNEDNATNENNVTIRLNGLTSMEYNITNIDLNSTVDANVTAFFDNIVAQTNELIKANKLHAFAYHDYVSGSTPTDAIILDTNVFIQGMEINSSTTIFSETNATTPIFAIDSNTSNDLEVAATTTAAAVPAAESLGLSWSGLVSDLKTNAIYTPDYATYGPLYTFKDAGYDVRSILKATTRFSSEAIAWDGIDLTRDESDWFKNNEFNLFNTNLHSGYWVYLEDISQNTLEINAASYTPTYTYYFDNKVDDEYLTTNIINGGQFTVEIKGFEGEINTAFVTVAGEEIQLERNGISDEYTADFMKYSLASFTEGSSEPISFTVRATDGKGTYLKASDVVKFDYTAPEVITPTVPNPSELTFSAADPATSDIVKFHVFREYIPELVTSRESADADMNRLVGSYTATAGVSTSNVCQGLDFGQVDNLRVVGVDGNITANPTTAGEIGFANVSNAIQYTYGVMLKDAHVLTHVAGTDDKAIVGLRYDSSCLSVDENLTATDNTGVSLKTLISSQTTRLAYEEIADVGSSLSGAWLSTYSIEGVSVIQVQNLEEYAGKPFFVEYGGKMYRSAFPTTKADAEASATTAIALDDSTAFALTTTAPIVRDKANSSGTGELISIINNTLAP